MLPLARFMIFEHAHRYPTSSISVVMKISSFERPVAPDGPSGFLLLLLVIIS